MPMSPLLVFRGVARQALPRVALGVFCSLMFHQRIASLILFTAFTNPLLLLPMLRLNMLLQIPLTSIAATTLFARPASFFLRMLQLDMLL